MIAELIIAAGIGFIAGWAFCIKCGEAMVIRKNKHLM
jgi:hypothetical protein